MTEMISENKLNMNGISSEAIEQLESVFKAYNETTNRMYQSYQQLQNEVVRLRKELEHKNEQLERKSRLAALGEMAAGMAHEIRNPLGGMQLYASLLMRDLDPQGSQHSWALKISKGIHNMDLIVNDILTFTQDQDCEKESIHFASLLSNVLDYIHPRITDKHIGIDDTGVDSRLAVRMDGHMMQRVFTNLILNAVEACQENGIVRISAVESHEDPEYRVRISIADTGEGIPPELMSRIFNPFFTTKDTGTGLGLAIVHRLVECHGGLITVTNNENGGATFTIQLP
jgi:signal transduction histidine kinase